MKRTILAACLVVGLGVPGCGPLRSMVSLAQVMAAAPQGYAARFATDGTVLAVRLEQPGMWDLVLHDPEVGDGAVVIVTGVVSGGGRGPVTHCWDMRSAPADWAAHVVYREPDGSLRPIQLDAIDHLTCD
jgi:hypothetical protein